MRTFPYLKLKQQEQPLKLRDPSRVGHLVLVLSGMELIFFLVVGTVPCFGFRMRVMWITN